MKAEYKSNGMKANKGQQGQSGQDIRDKTESPAILCLLHTCTTHG
jgi:hypothetical protein